jgi:outer membrane receptor protein involved in Fe transport
VLTLLAHGYLSARLTMKNLFDKSYRSPGSGIDAPGTNAIVTLEAHF